jgi:hypothetical protein
MFFLVFIALLVAIQVALAFGKCFAFNRVLLLLAGVFGMAGTAGGGLLTNLEGSTLLRLVTLDDTAQAGIEIKRASFAETGDSSNSTWWLVRKAELGELREQIKYELRLGNITVEQAATLSLLIEGINFESNAADGNASDRQGAAQHNFLADLTQSQARVNQALANTIKLVEVLDSVRSPEFAVIFIAAKIQVVRLLAEKAAIDGSIDDIRESMRRPKTG